MSFARTRGGGDFSNLLYTTSMGGGGDLFFHYYRLLLLHTYYMGVEGGEWANRGCGRKERAAHDFTVLLLFYLAILFLSGRTWAHLANHVAKGGRNEGKEGYFANLASNVYAVVASEPATFSLKQRRLLYTVLVNLVGAGGVFYSLEGVSGYRPRRTTNEGRGEWRVVMWLGLLPRVWLACLQF